MQQRKYWINVTNKLNIFTEVQINENIVMKMKNKTEYLKINIFLYLNKIWTEIEMKIADAKHNKNNKKKNFYPIECSSKVYDDEPPNRFIRCFDFYFH